MQINFEPKKIKEAHSYVDRLKPIKSSRGVKQIFKIDKKEKKVSFIKRVLNFLFN